MDRDQAADALDLVDRFVRQIPDENRTDRAAAFELAVRAHAALGQIDAGRAALAEIAVDRNSTVVFPAPLMSTIQELGAFLNRETTAAGETTAALGTSGAPAVPAPANGR